MATQEEKDLKQLARAEQKEEKRLSRKLMKAQEKEEKRLFKEQVNLKKAELRPLMERAKDERKPAKRAAKAINQERNPRGAVGRLGKIRQNFMGLPPALWPLMLVVSYIWAKNTWEKERQARDLREARLFLKENRDRK
jgi:hypothetical protein